MGETKHRSCLLLTSREKPKEVVHLEGKTSPVRTLPLTGLKQEEGQELLKDKGLFGSGESWADLIRLYSGNPLSLKLASEPIRELFGGDVASFLKKGETIVDDIYDLLDHQFHRLSELEQEIMYWLAVEREAVSLDDLQEDIVHSMAKGALLGALQSLHRRLMIEISGSARFTLQPVVMEYVTNRLVEQACKAILSESVEVFGNHFLFKALAKDYVRDSHVRFILRPIAQGLLSSLGREEIEKKLKYMLFSLRQKYSQKPSYAAGNVLNLLIHLGCDLRGYDFSHLTMWQTYLRGVALPEVNFAYANLARSAFTETHGCVLSMAFSPNRQLLAAGTATCEVQLWQVPEGTPLLTWRGHTDWIRSVAFSPDGKMLASGSDDQTIRLWEASTGECLWTLHGHTNWVHSAVFSPDSQLLASGSDDQTIRLWDVRTDECLWTLHGHTNRIRSVVFSPDGQMLASGSDDQTVRLWETSSGHRLKTLQGHIDHVWSVTFSPDGRFLASGSEDQTIRLWEVSTGDCLKTLHGHTNLVRSVAFNPDGQILASSSEDGTIKLWDVQSGKCLKTLRSERPYERMNITGVRGLTEAQKASLIVLGAIEEE